MLNDDQSMRPWCIEKATHVVEALVATTDAINQLPPRPLQDDRGLPTPDGLIRTAMAGALTDATQLSPFVARYAFAQEGALSIGLLVKAARQRLFPR